MDRRDIDPVGIGLERPLDFRRIDPDVVVMFGPPERVNAIRTQWHVAGRTRSRRPQGPLNSGKTARKCRLITHFDVVARQPGIGAHGSAIFSGYLVVVDHRFDDKAGKLA